MYCLRALLRKLLKGAVSPNRRKFVKLGFRGNARTASCYRAGARLGESNGTARAHVAQVAAVVVFAPDKISASMATRPQLKKGNELFSFVSGRQYASENHLAIP